MTMPPHHIDDVVDVFSSEVVDIDQAVTLMTTAEGADTAAIEALEAVVARLRRAQAARTRLATQVPPEVLRLALLRHSEATS